MSHYTPTIGMEVHVELKTKSKMFCACPNGMGLEKTPNVNICPVCTGQPGALPVANIEAIKMVQKVGLALNCKIAKVSKFDRKNYFYPDLPKGYQISQYDQPLCAHGYLDVEGSRVGIARIHIEEDTGKLFHSSDGNTLVDLNRSSVPLMELVTEPDITSAAQARAFCQKLQQILRYLEVSDADMEKGQMRCEVNISLYKKGEDRLSGTKVEIKNLNSFRVVERAAAYEITRQTALLEDGKGDEIVQETRGWHDTKQVTMSQRNKESAKDYRYFPEPDLVPMHFDDDYIEDLRRHLPELPDAKIARFGVEYNLTPQQCEVITESKAFANYFEAVVSELLAKIASGETKATKEKLITLAVNYLSTELQKYLVAECKTITDVTITPENFAELVTIVADGKINSTVAQEVLADMYYGRGVDPSNIIDEKGLAQNSDAGALGVIVDDILVKNPQSVADYKAGKQNAIQFLVGQTMKATRGTANPQVVMKVLKERLD